MRDVMTASGRRVRVLLRGVQVLVVVILQISIIIKLFTLISVKMCNS